MAIEKEKEGKEAPSFARREKKSMLEHFLANRYWDGKKSFAFFLTSTITLQNIYVLFAKYILKQKYSQFSIQ